MNIGAVATSDFMGFILLIALLISSKIRRTDDKHPEFKLYTVIAILTMVACPIRFVLRRILFLLLPGAFMRILSYTVP